MNTENNDWILMSEQKPIRECRPIWIHRPTLPEVHRVTLLEGSATPDDWGLVTHWKRAALPPPPPRAKTQREEDEEAYLEFIRTPSFGARDIWHAALAYRDAQNRADLEKMHAEVEGTCEYFAPLTRLRKRAGCET